MAKFAKVTEKIYSACKTLFESGATIQEVSDFFKLSKNTALYIKNSDTLEDYRHRMVAVKMEYEKRKHDKKLAEVKKVAQEVGAIPASDVKPPQMSDITKHTVIAMPTHWTMTELQKTNELLTQISNKLAFIVEQLT